MKSAANLLILSLVLTILAMSLACADREEMPARVEAIQGTVWVIPGGEEEQKDLQQGGTVNPWDTVTTDSQSRVVLQWPSGVTAAIGESSSLLISPVEMEGRQLLGAQVIGGMFRFARLRSGSASMPQYLVSTPVAAIYPAVSDQPVDFTVEVYDPTTTIITVVSGEVKVRLGTGKDNLLRSCQSVIIEQGKEAFAPFMVSAQDTMKILDDTTIPGTIAADLGTCTEAAQESPPPPETYESGTYGPPRYVVQDDYYYEDWDAWDFYPHGFVVRPPIYPGGGYLVVIPGVGEIMVEIPVYIEPAIVNVYIEQVFCRRGLGFYGNHLIGLRHRLRYAADMVAFARVTGNANLLARMTRQLDDLNLRVRWANRRISRLEAKFDKFKDREHAFARKIPRGVDLQSVVANSLHMPRNRGVAQKFQERLNADANVQARLAALATHEMGDLGRKISAQPNPVRRLQLREQLEGLRRELMNGKMVIPNKDKEVSSLGKKLQTTDNPLKRAEVQTKLLNQLNRVGETPRIQAPDEERELASLKQDLTKVRDPQGRQFMEKRLTALEHSVRTNKEAAAKAEETRGQIEAFEKQADREKNPQQRERILGQANELSRGLMTATQERRQQLKQLGPGMPAVGEGLKIPSTQPKVRDRTDQRLKEEASRQELKLKDQVQELKHPQGLDQQQRDRAARQQELKLQDQTRQQQLKLDDQARQQQLKLKDQVRQQELKHQQELDQQQRDRAARQQELKLQDQTRQQQLKLDDQARQQQLKLKDQVRQQELKRQQGLEQQQRDRAVRQQELKLQEQTRQQQFQRQQEQQRLQLQRQQQLNRQQQLQQERSQKSLKPETRMQQLPRQQMQFQRPSYVGRQQQVTQGKASRQQVNPPQVPRSSGAQVRGPGGQVSK